LNRMTLARAALQVSWVCGVLVAALGLWLIADGFLERGRAAAEQEQAEALELRVPTEAVVATELAAATELHTRRSMEREQRNLRLGWGLLIAVVAFLCSAKGYQELQFARQPTLVTLRGPSGVESPLELSVRIPSVTPESEDDAVDISFVDGVIRSTGRNRESAIPILQALQSHFRYLPEGALRRVCEMTEIEPAQIVGVASFYSQFRRHPVGRHLVRVCHGTACHVAGIEPIMDELRRRLEVPPDADTDPCRRFTLESVNCLGCCSLAPVMMVEEHVAGHLTPTRAWQELEASEVEG